MQGDECTTETGKAGTYDSDCDCIPNDCEEPQNTACANYEKTGDFDENGCHEYSKSCEEGTSCKLSDGTDGVCSKETCECVETTESEDGTEDIIDGIECTEAEDCLSFCSGNYPYYYDVERGIYTTTLNEKLNEESDINLVYRGVYLTTEGDIKYDIPSGDEDDSNNGLYSMDALGECHYTCVQNKCEEYLPACGLEKPGRGTYGIGCDNTLCFWETPIVLKGVDETWGYCPDNTTSEECILSIKDCIPCDDDEYSSPKNSIVECQLCPGNSVPGVRTDLNSIYSGTDADNYCVCSGGTYWNYTDGKCMSCPENAVVSENPAYRIYGWNVCGCASSSVVIKDSEGYYITGCCPEGQYWNGAECSEINCPAGTTEYDASAPTGDTFDVFHPDDTINPLLQCMCPAEKPVANSGVSLGDASPCQACSSGVYVFGSGCVEDYCTNPGMYVTDEASCQKWGEVCDQENEYVYVNDSCYQKTSYCDQPGQYGWDGDSCQKWGEVCIEDDSGATYIGSTCVGTSDMCSNMSTYVTDEDSCSVWSDACDQPMYWNVGECVDASSICETANSMTTDDECENLNTTYNCNVVWFKASERGYCYPFNNICPEEMKGNVVSDETSCLAWGSACGYSVSWGDECTVTVEASDDGSAV